MKNITALPLARAFALAAAVATTALLVLSLLGPVAPASAHHIWKKCQNVAFTPNSDDVARRLALLARHADPYERKPSTSRPIAASRPPVPVRRCSSTTSTSAAFGTKGTVRQYTAANVATGFAWAEIHASERNPRARHTRSSSTGSRPS